MRSSNYTFSYAPSYNKYSRKHIATKVGKHFMSAEEFLSIYELYRNIYTVDDFKFVLQLIKTSKTFKHYKTNKLFITHLNQYFTLDVLVWSMFCAEDTLIQMPTLVLVMQWLFSRTVHTNSLNSVTFR